MIVILSTGRSGTNFLANILKVLDSKYRVKHQQWGSRIINIIGTASICCPKYFKVFNPFILRLCFKKKEEDIIVDPLMSLFIYNTILLDKDQSAKVVHLIRDPRDFVTSFINWKSGSFKKTILHHIVPFWQPNPWLCGDVSLYDWLKMSKFEHYCWIWKFKNELFKTSNNPNNSYILVKMESLTESPDSNINISSLLNFIDKSGTHHNFRGFDNSKINNSINQNFPPWNKWTKEQAIILDHWCGDLMKELGYGMEDNWNELLEHESF